ncbi:unnamed protein product [Amoebophrya sp. A25]|nr:unnamed protein product [Amoebophrya sp. A25]|eukprot:GSA25T00001016001.1
MLSDRSYLTPNLNWLRTFIDVAMNKFLLYYVEVDNSS